MDMHEINGLEALILVKIPSFMTTLKNRRVTAGKLQILRRSGTMLPSIVISIISDN